MNPSEAFLNAVVPAWVIVVLWATILFLLLKKPRIVRGESAPKILAIVLAIDAFRTVFESIFFGPLYRAHFEFFPHSTEAFLESPLLLSSPKLVNLTAGFLVLFLVVWRWLPAMERELATKSAFMKQLQKEHEILVMSQAVAKVGSWETDLSTLKVTWSDETFRVFELDPATFDPTHEGFLALVHPDDRETVDSAFRGSFNTRKFCTIEHRILTREGRTKFIIERWQTYLDEAGNPSRAIGTCQDFTESKLAAQAAETAAGIIRVAGRIARLGAWSVTIGEERVDWSDETAIIHDETAGIRPTIEAALNYHAPEHRKVVEDAFFLCAHDGTPFEKLSQIITAKQRRVWVRVMGEAERLADGKIARVRGGIQDISTDIAKQEQLRLLETAISRLKDIVLIIEATPLGEPGPRIVYANQAMEKCSAYSLDEIWGQSPRKLQGPDTQRNELDRIRAALESHEEVSAELLNYTKSGEEYWLEIDIAPVQNTSGIYSHFVAIERDITERKIAEAKAEAIRHHLETLINEANIGIVIFQDFKPILANQESARIFGYRSESEILDLPDVRLLFAAGERERISGYINDRVKGLPAPKLYAVQGLKRDGSLLDLENRAFAVRWAGKIAICAMLTDVTEQKRTDEKLKQSQRLDAVGQLTGGVAHDFNNLLTVIMGNTELLEEGLAHDHELRSLAEITRTTAKRGAQLISRLLSFSRRQPLDPKVINVFELISGLESLLRRALGAPISIRIIAENDVGNALVDPSSLENAILNLSINARDAMPNGGTLTIEVKSVEVLDGGATKQINLYPGEYILIAVSDNGSGMSADAVSHAFEPFFTTKGDGRGSGLGLSMVYGFARQSLGHVSIYSELGVGTTVRLYLPKSNFEADSKLFEPQAADLPRGSEKILLVEDDDEVRDHVCRQVKSLGYDVISARNGPEAVEALKTHHFDLLFTDVVIPGGINGPELAKIARALKPELPILFTSGYSENAIIHDGRLDIGTELLTKPYERRDLAFKLRHVLERLGEKIKG